MKQKIEKQIKELLALMEIELDDLIVEEQERAYLAQIKSSRHGSLLIGRSGQNLEALQHILRMMISKEQTNRVPLVLDINNYRTLQEDELLRWVEGIVAEVAEKGESVKLEPMSGYDRRLIHLHLAEHPKVITVSEGDEPNRMLVIKRKPKE